MTSHILTEIERVATHVAILLQGRLLTVQRLEQGAATRLRLKVRSASTDSVRARLGAVPGVARVVSAAASADGVHDFVVEVPARRRPRTSPRASLQAASGCSK